MQHEKNLAPQYRAIQFDCVQLQVIAWLWNCMIWRAISATHFLVVDRLLVFKLYERHHFKWRTGGQDLVIREGGRRGRAGDLRRFTIW